MPTAAKSSAKKVTVKTGAKAKATKATAAKASGNGRVKRTQEDVDKMVPAFRKHLQGGGTMRDLKTEYGFSDDGPIRQALARAGFDSKGNKLELPTVAGTGKSIRKAREAGHAWYVIALATGKTEAEVKSLAEQAGMNVAGRVHVGGGRGR
jgi:hypothetical protein